MSEVPRPPAGQTYGGITINVTELAPRGSAFIVAPCSHCKHGRIGVLWCRVCAGTGIVDAIRVDGLAP